MTQPHTASRPETFAQPWAAPDTTVITGVRAVATAPEGIPLVVVRVDTNVDGLYGLGCATFTQRWESVVRYVAEHVEPLVLGRYPGDIADLTRLVRFGGYWRDGPVENNAVSGLDEALWDIAGKRAGLPVHELVGGKVRDAADTYLHASGASIDATLEDAERLIERGQRFVRLQTSAPGRGNYGGPAISRPVAHAPYPEGWSPEEYLRTAPELFAAARDRLPAEIGLVHDVHSRLAPAQAIELARRLEPYRLFFLEDVVAPEDWGELPRIKDHSPVPLAVGELATDLSRAADLVRDHGVDLIRCHVSMIGGFSAALKLAALAEFCGVRTAWHGPGDTSPIGFAANVALDVTSPAFGIQEAHVFGDAVREVFPGTLTIEHGWMRPNDAPGWGIDLDEKAAAAYPPQVSTHDVWAAGVRRPDGSLIAP